MRVGIDGQEIRYYNCKYRRLWRCEPPSIHEPSQSIVPSSYQAAGFGGAPTFFLSVMRISCHTLTHTLSSPSLSPRSGWARIHSYDATFIAVCDAIPRGRMAIIHVGLLAPTYLLPQFDIALFRLLVATTSLPPPRIALTHPPPSSRPRPTSSRQHGRQEGAD